GACVGVEPRRTKDLYQELKKTPRIASVTIKSAAMESFETTVAENQMRFKFFNVMFAVIIAFGVVYNSARIALAERSRELATLRVIGFTRAEVSAILLGELAVLVFLAIPVGLVMGYGFAAWAAHSLDTELFRIPLIINRSTYGFATVVVLLAALISGLIVRRHIDRLDLVSVLKSKE